MLKILIKLILTLQILYYIHDTKHSWIVLSESSRGKKEKAVKIQNFHHWEKYRDLRNKVIA